MESLLPFERIERKIIVKKQAETNWDFGKKPEERSVEELINYGIVNLNKPKGPTSHQVSAYVQQVLGIPKSGHSGTLDPHVTGVLPIALGKATRIVQTLLKAGKEYRGIMHLHTDVEEKEIKRVAEEFIAKIEQLPPRRNRNKKSNFAYRGRNSASFKNMGSRLNCKNFMSRCRFKHPWNFKIQ